MVPAQLSLFCNALLVVLLFQSLVFIIAIVKRNNGIADVAWGTGFIIISGIALFRYLFFKDLFEETAIEPSFILLISLVCIWAIRLSVYLFIRNWNKQEDWRYAKWRQDWGRSFYVRSFLQVFVLQGVLMTIIGYPILLAGVYSGHMHGFPPTIRAYLLVASGTLFWLIGFFFQAVGDYQLFVFKKDHANKGRIMRYGLWQYTRHPNYFGEAGMWWGIYLISCVSAWDLTGVLLRVISPLLITFMLLRVSGVTMLEDKYKGNEEYEDYQRNTSAFLPLVVPKKR